MLRAQTLGKSRHYLIRREHLDAFLTGSQQKTGEPSPDVEEEVAKILRKMQSKTRTSS